MRLIAQVTDGHVALATQDSSHAFTARPSRRATGMVMVNAHGHLGGWLAVADRTPTALCR